MNRSRVEHCDKVSVAIETIREHHSRHGHLGGRHKPPQHVIDAAHIIIDYGGSGSYTKAGDAITRYIIELREHGHVKKHPTRSWLKRKEIQIYLHG